ncbi:AAA family ATPase [Caloramator sp. Dgby_cultured_2]|nr:AAA family ATPase [Caloramator sp. Dgby_cultured_2]WDU84264.1 AAA family ATPase [Caloramator sp. Dgby_cultured_2]
MLLELYIKNFALIDEVKLEFSNNLNILTGETGAGKSIIIDSINFLLGEKQNKDIIRRGKDFAYVEGVFLCNNEKLQEELRNFGIDFDEHVIISREININGKNISRINGRTITVNFLKQIAQYLIDVHGQHEHQSLLNEENYIYILDSFYSGEELSSIKIKYVEHYEKFNKIDKK